jgi:hypothetical protein
LTDIDNKVYEITLIPEEDDANVETCKFRTTPLDVYDTIMGNLKETRISESIERRGADRERHLSRGIQDNVSMFLNFAQWPILVASVVMIVLVMRREYCLED